MRRGHGPVCHRRRRLPRGPRSADRPVAEALGGLRRGDQPDEGTRPARLTTTRAAMTQATAVVVGAADAALAMSRLLTERSIDHVVLERGEVANSWRTQRWP